MNPPLTSIRNPRVLAARKLLKRGERDRRGLFLVEGRGVLLEALASGAEIHDVFVDEELDDPELQEALAARSISPWIVARDVVDALSDTVTPQGAVAVVAARVAGVDLLRDANLALVLAQVRDPGNAGTLIRAAAAAGADAVVFTRGSVDPLHPKVVRSAAGALFRVPLVRAADLDDVAAALRAGDVQIVGADVAAPTDVYDLDLARASAIVLGNEAWGLARAAEDVVHVRVRIPMPGPVESLNVATAGSILLFEAVRQRRGTAGRSDPDEDRDVAE